MFRVFAVALAATLAALPSAAIAQPPRASAARAQDDQVQARYDLFVMEGVLERAVELGADLLSRQVRRIMPDMLLLSGAAQARGFRLEGYGIFFDVEVPALRRSVAWTLRTMIDENGVAATTALQQLKAHVQSLPDQRARRNLELALKRLELQVGPNPPLQAPSARPGPEVAATLAVDAAAPAPAPEPASAADTAFLDDPGEAYTSEVKRALIDAMLKNSAHLGVGPDEWLTVAARDNEHRDRLVPGDPYDVTTIVLRVKGSDLAAFRAERTTLEEARKRVEVREF